MEFQGKTWKFGADVDTDAIIPARYLNTSDPAELALHCMEDADPDFPNKVKKGDIIVADKNFGCGSSREHAPICIKAAGVACVIAKSYGRIFYRNSFNIGLLILEAPEAVDGISEGDVVKVDVGNGIIYNETTGKSFKSTAIPPFMQELIDVGGLINFVRGRLTGNV